MVFDKGIREGSIEAFDFRILLRTPGIRMEVHDSFLFQIDIKVFGKLRTIVRLYMGKRHGSNCLEESHEVSRRV